ncbi:hypothetical protein ACE2AJ_09870 [Aquihabitans daechungensis]|uniref:hypothetical protein n=1 Tax=Aquihabitans daechungensis TaxID=1052257 RepID=UPI003B9E377C
MTALALVGCAGGNGDDEVTPTTTLPEEWTKDTLDTAPPGVHLVVCIESSERAPQLVELSRKAIDTFLQDLVLPGGKALPLSESRPAVGVSVYLMDDQSFHAPALLEEVIPAQLGVDEDDRTGDDAGYSNALQEAGPTRKAALDRVTAAKQELAGAALPAPVPEIEIAGCGGRAAAVFDNANASRQVVIMLSTGLVKEDQDIDDEAKGILEGDEMIAVLLADSDVIRRRATTAFTFYGGVTGAEFTAKTGPLPAEAEGAEPGAQPEGEAPALNEVLDDILADLEKS